MDLDEDALVAAVDLIGRTGARQLHITDGGDDDSPPGIPTWHASAMFQGARIFAEWHPGPVEAAEALACKLITGARCAWCGGLTTLSDDGATAFVGSTFAHTGEVLTEELARSLPQCRWTRQGKEWVRGCVETHTVRTYGPSAGTSTRLRGEPEPPRKAKKKEGRRR